MKPAAFSRPGKDFDISLLRRHHFPGQIKADSQTLGGSGFPSPVKPPENPGDLFFSDSHSAVRDFQAYEKLVRRYGKLNPAALRRVFDGIIQNISGRFPHPSGIKKAVTRFDIPGGRPGSFPGLFHKNRLLPVYKTPLHFPVGARTL